MITADQVSDNDVGSNGLLFSNVTVWTPEIDRLVSIPVQRDR